MNKVKDLRNNTEDPSSNPGGVVMLENSPAGEENLKVMEVSKEQSRKYNSKSTN